MPLLMPMESAALFSARHQETMPAGGGTGGVTRIEKIWVAASPPRAVALIVKLNVTALVGTTSSTLVGTPLIRPCEFSFKPGGKAPPVRAKVTFGAVGTVV